MTALLQPATSVEDRTASGRAGADRSTPRLVLAAVALATLVAGLAGNSPTLVLTALVATTTALVMRRVAWDLALPLAVLVLLAVATATGVVAGLLDVDLLASSWTLAVGYVAYAVAALWWAPRPAARTLTRPAPGGSYAWLAYSGAAVAAAIGFAQAFVDRMTVSWGFVVTDFSSHLLLMQEVQRSGHLDYSVSGYPRAFHMLLSFASVPRLPTAPLAMLGYDTRLLGAATWLSVAVFLWAGAAVCLRFAVARKVASPVAIVAALVFGTGVLLTNNLLSALVYMGGGQSFLAAVAILALPLAVVGLRNRRLRAAGVLVLAAMSIMLLSHLWQPLVLVPLLAVASYAAPRLRQARVLWSRRDRSNSRANSLLAVLSFAMLAVAAVPVLSIQREGGIANAAIDGTLSNVPWPVLILGMAVAAWLILDLRRGTTRLFLGGILGMLGVVAVMLVGADHGFELRNYYPMKALWFLLLAISPVTALVVTDVARVLVRPVWSALGKLGSAARLTRFAVIATLIAVAFALWLPALLGRGSMTWASVQTHSSNHNKQGPTTVAGASSDRYDVAVAYATRYRPDITVPIGVGFTRGFNANGPYIISKLISFQTGQVQNGGQVDDVCREIAIVTDGKQRATVITQIDPKFLRQVLTKQGCGYARVAQVPEDGNYPR